MHRCGSSSSSVSTAGLLCLFASLQHWTRYPFHSPSTVNFCKLSLRMQPGVNEAAAAAGRQLLAQTGQAQASPAAPRVHLSFQLAGYSTNASLAAAIQDSLMPTAVKVLQKMFQVRRMLSLSTPHAPSARCCTAHSPSSPYRSKQQAWAFDAWCGEHHGQALLAGA
jgi:hypothetical protein